MDADRNCPLDMSEFKCTAASRKGVVVVFEQTNRRYTYAWQHGELAIAAPDIQGACDPHPAEVIDCLARAVAYRAALAVRQPRSSMPLSPRRSHSTRRRGFLPLV